MGASGGHRESIVEFRIDLNTKSKRYISYLQAFLYHTIYYKKYYVVT